ncbi:ATP-binding protein [Bacillus sp. 31A1R]|uniref:histidine kinase n=1 Tax=Robertmurraya mangrovi TaxID=3098077 RepID=A0ABU5IVN3_9BACI|nr:ATP-binding protein [Bacillus sp. 31A1R]MDZ5471214.1 ATP-binding protein [Bacillus sp. 31A1R]
MKNKLIYLYIIFGMGYVLVSDYLVARYVHEDYLRFIQLGKAFLFVLLTAIFFHQLNKKKRELDEVKKAEQQFSTLINSMVDFVCFKDGEGRWLETNTFGLKLFQLEHVDYKGKTDRDLAEYTEFYREALIYCQEVTDEIAWNNKDITRCEETIPLPDGTNKTFDTIKQPLFNEDGSRKGLIVIGRDITERKIAEEKLIRTEKLSVIGELAASVAHEVRNPLTSLKGFVQLLKEKDHSVTSYYDIMLSELDRINHIVGELLLLAKPQELKFSTCDVSKTLGDVMSLLETQANMTNVQLNYHSTGPVFIDCEENQMKQLFINIVKNGIEASGEKGDVSVYLNKLNDQVQIIVEDSGPGIPGEFLYRLGEPYYSSKEKGTGLGLTVSFKIVEQHKGNIRFKNRDGNGTRVEILFPVSPTLKN